MKITISQAKNLSKNILHKLGFCKEETSAITESLIEAELVGKPTHGLIRLVTVKKLVENGELKSNAEGILIKKETGNSLHIDGNFRPGWSVIYKSLDLAFRKIKKVRVLAVGIKDMAYASGYIGGYARKATEKDLIFIGFNNSSGGLVPYGARKELWGTDPITVGIPAKKIPVILDMASSKISWGKLLVAKQEGRKLEKGVAIDKDGNITTDPVRAMEGGLLPIADHKGSGLAFIVELLAGALTSSRVGYAVEGGWGCFYILIDPTIFRPIKEFKKDVSAAISELKNAPKMRGFEEIYFPGERSQKLRIQHFQEGKFEISNSLYELLEDCLDEVETVKLTKEKKGKGIPLTKIIAKRK